MFLLVYTHYTYASYRYTAISYNAVKFPYHCYCWYCSLFWCCLSHTQAHSIPSVKANRVCMCMLLVNTIHFFFVSFATFKDDVVYF